jgi:glycerol-3-phosphate dehydrogenase (NAD+)
VSGCILSTTLLPLTFLSCDSGFGGRNRKCAEAFVKTGKHFDQLEKELLNGQKLQGSETAREVHNFLQARGKVDDYPLFKAVYNIAFEGGVAGDLASKL